jgi:hypothetical protein
MGSIVGFIERPMPEFLIERIMPGVEQLDVEDIKETSKMGMAVIREQFPDIEWLQSYATKDILYCLYRAPSETLIREYARGSTLPVHRILEVCATITPDTL